jgi:predicted secreted protein
MILDQTPTPNITDDLVAEVSEIMESVEMNSTMAREILESGAKVALLLTATPSSEQIAEIRSEMTKAAEHVVDAAAFQPECGTLRTNVESYQDPQNQEISRMAAEEFLDLLEVVENPARGHEIINDDTQAEKYAEKIAKVLNWFKLKTSKSKETKKWIQLLIVIFSIRSKKEKPFPFQ